MGIIRKTKSVEEILSQFEKNKSAISVTSLVKDLQNSMNKTTVYRALDRLEDDGVLHSFIGTSGIKWYAKCQGCSKSEHFDVHPHFECVICGNVDCLNIDISIPKLDTRSVKHTHVLIQGTCETCLNE